MPNALIKEKSPYLKQHAENPVDWLPWGEAAFAKARAHDKPIFLSIGYSTCHWCHVMAHESFEDEATAAILNRDFICIKVDREERPDMDRIYMLFVQATTGSGGWPMSVFLTPSLKPFFGGTYFPPDNRYGRPGFPTLLGYLTEAWKNERSKIEESGENVAAQLRQMADALGKPQAADLELFKAAYPSLRRTFDKRNGGFGSAPKFPRPSTLNYLFRYYFVEKDEEAMDMAQVTLTGMALGGMCDQLGGGFHRYSVDERWFVPHFEKMLYDQSQLAISYLESFQLSGNGEHAEVARRIFNYVLRDLTSPEGAFYSAEDADSPDPENPKHSGEGSFYIWRKSEIDHLAGETAEVACRYYGVEADGNVEQDPHGEFRGRNILYVADPLQSPPKETVRTLFEARAKRPRPHLDSKILTAWNSLMISAFATGYLVLEDEKLLVAAVRVFGWVWQTLYVEESNSLWRRFSEGEAGIPAFLDDYASLGQAALTLFEATGEVAYLGKAKGLAEQIVIRFEDADNGGFFSTEAGASDLLLRMKDDYDGAEPSGNSTAADLFVRLTHILGDDRYAKRATRAFEAASAKLKSQPTMAPQMLCALGRSLASPEHFIVRVADDVAARSEQVRGLLSEKRRQFQPFASVFALTDKAAAAAAAISPFLGGLKRQKPITIYHCQNLACALPVELD